MSSNRLFTNISNCSVCFFCFLHRSFSRASLFPDQQGQQKGFHIYDVGFQSPNVEAARPLVYATALLLVLVTILLNIVAIAVRNRLREKYRGLET